MATLIPIPVPLSTRGLIAELAGIEDALRVTPTFAPGPAGREALSQELLTLLDRQAEILAALRGQG